jgi:hypothetical protein
MHIRRIALIFTLTIAHLPSSHADSMLRAYASPKVGFQLFKPTDLTLGGGIHLGLEAGYHFEGIGNAIVQLNTTSFDSDTQMTHYQIGFSREIIWGIVASATLGLQSIFDREIDAGIARESSPTGSSFAFGLGASYLTEPVLVFRNNLNLQLIPEIAFYKGNTVNWYGASLGFRFNWMTAEQPVSTEP